MKKIVILAAVIAVGCRSGADHDHDHDHEYSHSHNHEQQHDSCAAKVAEAAKDNDDINFTPRQAALAGLATETVAPGDFARVIRASGEIVPAQGGEAIAAATQAGVVSFGGASLAEGSPVRRGQTIATVSGRNMPEGDPAIRARATFETARNEYRRAESLVKEQVVSQKEFETARAAYETARAAYEASSRGGGRATSPIDGYIKNLLVRQGDYVSVGQPVAVIVQDRRLQLRAELPERYFRDLPGVRSANFTTPGDGRTYHLDSLRGRLLSYGRGTGALSPYIPVTFEFDNVGDIPAGSPVEVALLAAPRRGVISVPLSALTEEQGLRFVYLKLDEDCYRRQEVALGADDGARVEVVKGLQAGDEVVTAGAYRLKLAAAAGVMPEGHNHSH
ncbi:MAG: efflux RND transporter periplasmic adaptor subunit [Rikenellaceae bacterium]|jgi:RND family efflux transporter MFP subunit|nr:efflux RND transporter periplasmic adaptor subunit [Rikenellaceae bacterium]